MGAFYSVLARRAVGAALIGCAVFFAFASLGTVIDQGLSIQKTGANQYTVSWSAFLSQGLGLRVAPGVINPMWGNVGIPPTTVGNKRQVVLTAGSPSFFRLDCTADGNQDMPDDGFTDNDCDGIDGNIASAIFVSTTTGNDANPGTPQQPVATIAQGITTAQNAGKVFIYVAAGDYAEPTLNLPPVIYIFGAYSASDWSRSESNITRILSTSSTAVVVQQNANLNFLDHLTIVAANAPQGQSSYGVRVQFNFNIFVLPLQMRRCTVQAGNGGSGQNSSNGTMGGGGLNNATAGGDGCGCIGGSCVQPVAGSGGTGTAPCNGHNGGAGGTPGSGFADGQTGNNGDGASSCPGGPGCGGTAGSPNGVAGAAGASGTDGAAGFGNYGLGYSVTDGVVGTNGTFGNGGGGGAGGHGGERGTGGFPFCTSHCALYGGAGSGGGSGGCGGTFGSGGGSAGGSFAVYVEQAKFFIDQCTIITGNGGNGGTGGTGGAGGVGRAGRTGGAGVAMNNACTPNPVNPTPQEFDAQAGGNGGNGGNGGRGGHGGGGAGGPSIGVVYSFQNSQFFGSSNTYIIGSGGSGGASPGNSGPAGGSAQIGTF